MMFALSAATLLTGCVSPPRTESKTNPDIDMCYANAVSTLASALGKRHSTFVLVDIPNVRATIANFKSMATQAGYQIGEEEYNDNGKEGKLTIFMPATSSAVEIRHYITVDQALGAISIASRENPTQEILKTADTRQLKFQMCGLIALATDRPLPPLPEDSPREQKNINTAIFYGALDRVFQRAQAAGKSFVIVPALNLDSKYPPDQAQSKRAEFRADQSSTTLWRSLDNPQDVFKVGYDESLENMGLNGYVYSFVSGKSHYHLYIVNPGTYSIAGHTYEIEQTRIPEVNDKQKSSKSRLGKISFIETKNIEFYQTKQWFDAIYEDRQYKQEYCAASLLLSGHCVSWGSVTYDYKEKVSQEGWRAVTKSQHVPGLIIAAKLAQNFATFKVGKGEAIIVDGFVAQYPSADFNAKACKSTDPFSVQCDLNTYSLTRVPARVQDIQPVPPGQALPHNLQNTGILSIPRDNGQSRSGRLCLRRVGATLYTDKPLSAVIGGGGRGAAESFARKKGEYTTQPPYPKRWPLQETV